MDEVAAYGDAMLFGYRAMDRLIGKFMTLAEETGATLVFATALSQQPYTQAEASGGKHFYRLRDVKGLFQRLDLTFAEIAPTMTHQYLATFAGEAQQTAARKTLSALKLDDGRPLFDFNARTREGLYFSCNLSTEVAGDAVITGGPVGLRLRDIA